MQLKYFKLPESGPLTSSITKTPPPKTVWQILMTQLILFQDNTTVGTRDVAAVIQDNNLSTSNMQILAFCANNLTTAGSGTGYVYGAGSTSSINAPYNSANWTYDGVNTIYSGSGSGLVEYLGILPSVVPGTTLTTKTNLLGSDTYNIECYYLEMSMEEWFRIVSKQ